MIVKPVVLSCEECGAEVSVLHAPGKAPVRVHRPPLCRREIEVSYRRRQTLVVRPTRVRVIRNRWQERER